MEHGEAQVAFLAAPALAWERSRQFAKSSCPLTLMNEVAGQVPLASYG